MGGHIGLDAVKGSLGLSVGPQPRAIDVLHSPNAESDTGRSALDPHPPHLSVELVVPRPSSDRGCGTGMIALQADNDHFCGGLLAKEPSPLLGVAAWTPLPINEALLNCEIPRLQKHCTTALSPDPQQEGSQVGHD